MNRAYTDILSRIADEPLWFDENSVPRYCVFAPAMVADLYSSKACLLLIRCQSCAKEFKVAMSENRFHPAKTSLIDMAKAGDLHYGDPPNVYCCAAGPTENSVPIRCLEFWTKDKSTWTRVPEAEVEQEGF